MYDLEPTGRHSDGDIDVNTSSNLTFGEILAASPSRRAMLGGMTAVATLFGLSACDDDGGIDGTEVTIAAGSSGASSSGKVVTLTGTVTGTSTVQWTQVSGPPVELTNANTNTATFIAPSVSAATPLVFRFSGTGQTQGTVGADTTVTISPAVLGFTAIAKNRNDVVTVPEGYTVTVLLRTGDPITAAAPAYRNDGTDTDFASRAGDHHDALYFYGLAAGSNARDDNNNARGLLVQNHENITETYLHTNGQTPGATRVEAEAIKEIECHGVSVVEVLRGTSGWNYVQNSTFNRRITPNTPMQINGPARGAPLMRTVFSPTGVAGRGTINNCANGYAPWGTYLTCEENWAGYFRRPTSDNANRPTKEAAALARYGVTSGSGAYNWSSVVPSTAGDSRFAKWNATAQAGGPADGTGDYRHEPNQYGWVVEIDPFNPQSTPRKRTALGRMGHEGAWPSNFVAGQRPVFYMGDDSRNEYFYKFVSATPWNPADAQTADRLAIGDKYLDTGTLYVARFDATGQGAWLPLVFGQGALTAANTAYPFTSQSEVLINTRGAADAVGATKMDRPEWAAVNPVNGEVYLTLTNNAAAQRPLTATDAANPRFYNDQRTTGANQLGNPNGHIIRLREAGNTAEATTFTWDIYAFGAGADLPAAANVSGLDATNDFSSPDGLWFSRGSNAGGRVNPLLWIQTDDGAFTDQTNCMMLAAMPGVVGDGGARTIANTDGTTTRSQATLVGRNPGMSLRRFLVGPNGCEITGVDTTPDGRTMFVNIQHPGESVGTTIPATFQSNWPANQGAANTTARPRSATIVITKNDGGVIGL